MSFGILAGSLIPGPKKSLTAVSACVKTRDEQGVALFERVLLGCTRRMVLLLAEHRRCCDVLPRRVSIMVGGNANVLVAPR